MAESLDFQINDLKFRAATSDKFPYARATAPFRKEQFDAAPTVGDQSLSGWWTRGQLSFHKGAGIKFYEVLDGGEVLNHYYQSLGMDTLSTPGESGLYEEMAEEVPATADLWWAQGFSGISGEWVFDGVAYLAGYELFTKRVGGTIYPVLPVDGTTIVDACSVPEESTIYGITSGKKVERLLATPLHVRQSLYSHSVDLKAIFHEKNRLWVVDKDGNLYAVGANPTGTLPLALGSADLVATFPPGDVGRLGWSLTASTGAVYISNSSSVIYAVTVNTSSGEAVPSTIAVVAATLPQGENVRFLQAHLGQVVIGTTRGVRVAEIDSGGGLTYGPLHETGESGQGCCVEGTSVWFVGAGEGATSAVGPNYLTKLDLSTSTGDGMFAWDRREELVGSSYHRLGVFRTLAGRLGYTHGPNAGTVHVETMTGLRSTGSLTTGFHRMGTLDDKHFHSTKVRVGGDGGTVSVYRIDEEDGAGVYLGDVSAGTSATLSMGLTAPQEKVALRFDLNRDSTDATKGPVLLGYQIKALPSPVRQRLIKWPLLITDTYKDRHGATHGARDGAWPAWETLETLEESDALVTYTDHRTGETGEAYIESLELQTDTPPKGASTGFGGVGYITLRKVG